MSEQNDLQRRNKTLALKLGAIVLGMCLFTFAMVPLYDVFCEVFGINGKTEISDAQAHPKVNLDRLVTVEFVGQTDRGMPWDFVPVQHSVVVHPGETKVVSFHARNRSDADMVGQAVYSVAPGQAALFINKTECFCFRQQPLAAGKSAELSLAFYVDPDLPEHISSIAMQYTLYDATASAKAASKEAVIAAK